MLLRFENYLEAVGYDLSKVEDNTFGYLNAYKLKETVIRSYYKNFSKEKLTVCETDTMFGTFNPAMAASR